MRETPSGQLLFALFDLSMRDRALTLAGQAFIAVVPLVIVLATWLSASDGRAIGDWLVSHFGLEGTAAEAVDQLFRHPPEAVSGVSVLGMVFLFVAVNSFARTLQRTYEAAWDLPPKAPRRAPNRFGSLALLCVLLVGVTWVTGAVRHLPVGGLLALPAQLVVAVPAWVCIADLLLSRRVAWRLLVPGAAITAVAQLLASWAAAIWVPHLIEGNAERYGVVGVAVALVSWMIVLAFALVACATAGAWAAHTFLLHDKPPTVPGGRSGEP